MFIWIYLYLNDLYWCKSNVVYSRYALKRDDLKEMQEPRESVNCVMQILLNLKFVLPQFQCPLYANHILFDEIMYVIS